MSEIFFNLVVNSAFSLACGLMVVSFFIWLFRVENGPWKLFLLSLPFVKVVYDCLRGLPADSILLRGVDPFLLPPKHQLLQVGMGFSSWGPTFNVIFSVEDVAKNRYAASVGDYLTFWIKRTFGADVPLMILSIVLLISVALLLFRIVSAIRFERKRKLDRAHCKSLRIEKLKFPQVDIYISEGFSGTPFTGGVLKPYICIPQDAFEKLQMNELEAVIAHELGHIRQWDLPVTVAIQMLGDIFWFVPGYRWLSRKIDRLREVVADQWAVRIGVEPAVLASVLVKLKEIPETSDRFVLYSAFFREKSLLKLRVDTLLGQTQERPPRFGWKNIWLKAVMSLWICAAVMMATFGGNQSKRMKNPEWFNSLLKNLRLEFIHIDN